MDDVRQWSMMISNNNPNYTNKVKLGRGWNPQPKQIPSQGLWSKPFH